MNATARLRARQSAMQSWLLHGDAGVAHDIDATGLHAGIRDDRLRLYADAYRLRLCDVLGNDFPTTRSVLGESAFETLALGYLQAHPSTQPSVRHFGHAFPGWLAQRHGLPRALPGLARFEWVQGLVFDAAEAGALAIEHVASLPAEDWPALRLRLRPSVRLLPLACNAPTLVEARARQRPLPRLRATAPSHWLLWREAGDVHWRRLDADEAQALCAIAAGECFARLCERLDALHGSGGALRAASLLKRWLADGLLAADGSDSLPD